MESLIFATNAVTPIVIMVVIGYILKRIGLINASFAKMANTLIFRVFLPAMLFLNIYKIDNIKTIELGYVVYAVSAIIIIFLISYPLVIAFTKYQDRRGALLQASFRSNYALIGIPIAQALCGDDGVAVASLLSAICIPIFNVLAIISLSVFRYDGKKPNVNKILSDIIKNPLIQSVFIGLVSLVVRALFVKYGVTFRLTDIKPLYTVLSYLSSIATPLSLLVLGAQFEFSAIKNLRREIIFGTVTRTVVVPTLCIGVAFLFFRHQFNAAHFATFIALFATPVAISSVPMAQEMQSDAILAGQLVVWTTLMSVVSVFSLSLLLRLAGVF